MKNKVKVKVIINFFFLLFSLPVNSEVSIYKNGMSFLGLEKTSTSEIFTSTLYGGSIDAGASSPADCTVKYQLEKNDNGFTASLMPFSSELMSYTTFEKMAALFEFDKTSIIFVTSKPLEMCPLSTLFSGHYVKVPYDSNEFEVDFNELLQLNYYNAVKEFRSGNIDIAIRLLEPYMSECLDIKIYHPHIYNDYGYFLQQAGMNSQAIEYFNIVKNKSPQRAVVYLNLADAYWEIKNQKEASINYKKYIEVMKRKGKSKLVPIRAIERCL